MAEDVGIILRDYKGEETIHYGKEQLEVDTTDGGTALYVREDLVAEPVEKTVELDFSGGDMVVVPEDGQVFSGVNIPTPANLTPENIAEGVDIAGIVGAMVAGGAGTAVSKRFLFTCTNEDGQVVEHGLGIVPDVVIVQMYSGSGSYANAFAMVGISTSFWQLTGAMRNKMYSTLPKGTGAAIDENKDAPLSNAGTSTIKVGSSNYLLNLGAKYEMIAIGGLT